MFSTRTGCFFIRVILIPCNALNVIARHCQIGDPAGYCVLAGKRRTQAKDKQLSLTTIVWSKVQCAPWGNDNTTATAVVMSFDVFRIKELWIVICVNFGARGDFRPVCRSTARRLPLSFRSPKNLQEGFRPHTDYTCRWLRVRALTGLSPAPVF